MRLLPLPLFAVSLAGCAAMKEYTVSDRLPDPYNTVGPAQSALFQRIIDASVNRRGLVRRFNG